MIGDTQTAALVGRDGSIDWWCVPRFDSGSCFARLLGDDSHGRWLIAPTGAVTATGRRYLGPTLVLETEFTTATGVVRVIDFMPPRQHHPRMFRIVEGVSGQVEFQCELAIRFDYGEQVPWVSRVNDATRAVAGPDALWYVSPVELEGRDHRSVGEFTVHAGERVPFILNWYHSYQDPPPPLDAGAVAGRHHGLVGDVGPGRGAGARGVAGAGAALADHPQGAHLRADRGDRRRGHHVAARGDRRGAQLGLPLLLGARRHPDPRRPDRGRAVRARPGSGCAGWCGRRRERPNSCRSCTARRGSGASPSSRWTGCPATSSPNRSGWATPPPTSSSSTSTAS